MLEAMEDLLEIAKKSLKYDEKMAEEMETTSMKAFYTGAASRDSYFIGLLQNRIDAHKQVHEWSNPVFTDYVPDEEPF